MIIIQGVFAEDNGQGKGLLSAGCIIPVREHSITALGEASLYG